MNTNPIHAVIVLAEMDIALPANGSSLATVVVLLVLMAGAATASWIFIRRGGLIRATTSSNLKLLESRALGSRQFLMVVDYCGQKSLLGVCPGRINFLCSLDEKSKEKLSGNFSSLVNDLNDKA